jgi:hypothetical protein
VARLADERIELLAPDAGELLRLALPMRRWTAAQRPGAAATNAAMRPFRVCTRQVMLSAVGRIARISRQRETASGCWARKAAATTAP